jgi:hypothetical protein
MKVFAVREQYISNVRQDQANVVFLQIQLSAPKDEYCYYMIHAFEHYSKPVLSISSSTTTSRK